jgi:predicted CopG family antitoxin
MAGPCIGQGLPAETSIESSCAAGRGHSRRCVPRDEPVLLLLRRFDLHTQSMHDLCMATKTISIEIDAYDLLVRERKDPKESFSRVIRRVLSERPALTAGDLLDAMRAFEGRGAGPRRRRSRDAAA